MLDDMALGVMGWLERKILTTTQDSFEKNLRKKRELFLKQKPMYDALPVLNSQDFIK
jgi:hypothetical protein